MRRNIYVDEKGKIKISEKEEKTEKKRGKLRKTKKRERHE